MEVTRLDEITWLVGRPKTNHVTQSFTFMVDTPKIDQDNLDFLTEHHGVDSWIMRLIVQRGSEQQDLGSLYIPFRSYKINRGSKANAPNNASIKVYYAAAYASERFRNLSCPPFGHDLRIKTMEIKGEASEFTLSVTQSTPYSEKSQLAQLSPSTFNGGNSLKGEYFIEIAPYNAKKKVILSSFKRIPQSIVILSEERIDVKNCAGVHSEIK